jgi:hypothetical protein
MIPQRTLLGALLTAGAILLGLLQAAPASAEGAWWHLSAGARPSYLRAGSGKPGVSEVQEIFTEPGTIEGFAEQTNFVLILNEVAAKKVLRVEEFATEPLAKEFGVELLSAANIQSALERPSFYGPGNVTVKEESTDKEGKPLTGGDKRYVVTSAPQTAGKLLEGKAEEPSTLRTAELSKGRAPSPDGELYLTAENLGDQSLSAQSSPVKLTDVLPKGLKAVAVEGTKPSIFGFLERSPLDCAVEASGARATCTMSREAAEKAETPPHEALAPYDQLEMRISVDVEGPIEGEQQASVSGGESFVCKSATSGPYKDAGCIDEEAGGHFERLATGAVPASSIKRPVTESSAPVPFGVESYELANEEEGGTPTTQAGAHPFQQTTTIVLNQTADSSPPGVGVGERHVNPAGIPKDLHIRWPAGLIGNPTPIPQCTDVQFFATTGEKGSTNFCPPDTAVGVATVLINEPANTNVAEITVPLFNLVPRPGEPARFGFNVVEGNAPVTIDTSLRTGGDYGVTVSANNITQTAAFLSSEVTVWGVPGDPRHNSQRGWACLAESRGRKQETPCSTSVQSSPPPFLSLPTNCTAPLQTSVEGDPWAAPGDFQDFAGLFEPTTALDGCNRLPFSAEIKVAPDGHAASTPTGLTVDVHVPQEEDLNAQGLSSSNIKDIDVTLPEGVVLNPAAADGLQACSQSQIGYLPNLSSPPSELRFTEGFPECPDAAKVGTVKIKTPLLPNPLEGAVYLAAPDPNAEGGQNPFNTLVAMYIVAKDPVSGSLVKLPGKVVLNQSTGRIESSFEDTPQLAFEDAELHFFGGERAPLATPAKCGTYTTEATFTPWSGTTPIKSSSSFQITSGPNGSPCPSSQPFSPTLQAGSPNVNAGAFSALSTTISREDGNQNINTVQLRFPPGMSGILTGIPLCPEEQANAGTCPEASKIGETIVSVGLGGDPYTVTGGKVYLTAPYQGAPFGLSIVNPAVAGPFNLGKVIVRAKIEVNPLTAALSVSTGQIPHILDGIPLQIKHVNVDINRQNFTFNPTNCSAMAIKGTIGSVEGASAEVETPLQVTNCAALKFAPKFTVETSGKTSKALGASLHVKLVYPQAPPGTYANLAKAKVSLPKQLPSRLTTLQKACTAQVFNASANHAACPKDSIVGHAKVITPLVPVPLEGPAYFVSHGGEAFPDLTMVLQGYGITIELIGKTQIKNGITTTTFNATPDAPFTSFELTLPDGPDSALAANANLCTSKLTMPSEFIAQDGAPQIQNTPIAVTGCKKLTNAQKLSKALKECRKKKNKAKRKGCEAQARKRYPVGKGKKAGGKK